MQPLGSSSTLLGSKRAKKPISGQQIKEPLQVRIPRDIKRSFKAHAALRGIEPNELFVEVWEHYERTHV
jgi:cell wall assembly regulator SMI1